MSDWSEETRVRLAEEATCMEQPEAVAVDELAADVRAALARIEELERELSGAIPEDVMMRNTDLVLRVEELEQEVRKLREDKP